MRDGTFAKLANEASATAMVFGDSARDEMINRNHTVLFLTMLLAGALSGCAARPYSAGRINAPGDPALAVQFGSGPEAAEDGLMPDDPLAAARFRYEQRLSENGTVPANALM